MPRSSLAILLGLLALPCFLLRAQRADEPPKKSGDQDIKLPADTEGQPLPPAEALKRVTVPPGFNVTLFAHEPDIRQPIAMTFDDRGRLWVCECYSYPDFKSVKNRDRVVILEDTDHDGRHDKRTVFWDRGNSLTGIEFGYGGIFVSCAPHLLFIPDKNGDDRPDGEPEILLDGWTTKAQHNVFNGLKWGPDGWLYGCHGITASSRVARPGTPDDKRVPLNCCIWRYHPTRKTFEVVAHGTTNPWGIDFNEYGEGFFTNCVIDHAFHLIPGAHYKRMFGQDLNPYVYELMDAASDHLHWGGGHWTESRKGDEHDSPGGGHAHSGTLIYLGDNFPKEYYGSLFTCNIHGHRVNNDSLERKGSGWVAKHRPDFFKANDPWFRGVALAMGPDGGMYIADWSDTGECHDYQEVHRNSGRIYKVVYEKPKEPRVAGDPKYQDADPFIDGWDFSLTPFDLLDPYEWQLRRFIRLGAESGKWRSGNREDLFGAGSFFELIHPDYESKPLPPRNPNLSIQLLHKFDVRARLRAMFLLHASSAHWSKLPEFKGTPGHPFVDTLSDKQEVMCANAIRALHDFGPPDQSVTKRGLELAKSDRSSLVRLALCSAVTRLTLEDRWSFVEALTGRPEDESDNNIPLMLWYGIEPCVPKDPKAALELALNSKLTKPRKYIVRRLCEPDLRKDILAAIVAAIANSDDSAVQLSMLAGMSEAFGGLKNQPLPNGWDQLTAKLAQSDNQEIKKLVRTLSLIFGDPAALAELQATLSNENAKTADRIAAIELLSERKSEGLVPQLVKLLDQPSLRLAALRGLSAYDDASTPTAILKRYKTWDEADRIEAINTLASRASYAAKLLDALESKQIHREDVSPFHARQLAALKNRDINSRLARVWGRATTTSGDKQRRKDEIKSTLPDSVIEQADLRAGRVVFSRMCGQCHSLFGEGAKIGPELTGAQRANLDYVLENLIDPNAIVGQNYQMTVATLDDGRVVSGVIESQNDATVTLKTTSGKTTLTKSEIDELQTSPVSMMPEGQLEKLSAAELRDLVAYLRSPRQVPLPNQ